MCLIPGGTWKRLHHLFERPDKVLPPLKVIPVEYQGMLNGDLWNQHGLALAGTNPWAHCFTIPPQFEAYVCEEII